MYSAWLHVQVGHAQQEQQSLMDSQAVQPPAPSPQELLAQLQPPPQLELQLGPQEVQVRPAPTLRSARIEHAITDSL
jgi:hypothetical protein